VNCLSYSAFALWELGYPEQALKQSQEAVALAQGLSHPFSLVFALGFAALFHSFRREEQLAREQAEAVMSLSTEQGFPYWLAWGMVMRGSALAEWGQVEDGIAQIQQGLAAFRTMGTVGQTGFLPWLAAAYAKVGRVEEGLSVVAEALAAKHNIGDHWCEAELYRLKGELTLQKLSVVSSQLLVSSSQSLTPNTQTEVGQEAEGYFRKAIEIAQKQQAKSWELRATTSLARLWQRQGKAAEAQQVLVAVYNWFTEGFDTADLQDAKRLIEELS
jgi:predicted ATPase